MSPPFLALQHRLQTRDARIGIIGLGYAGLPLARAFVDSGFAVLGLDVDSGKVAKLQRGESYVGHIAAHVIARMRQDGFEATDHFQRLHEVDAILLCVPTPLTETREPDLGPVIRSSQAVAAVLRPGQLVVLESTTYPGTTRQVLQPILEKSGLEAGNDFFLGYSSEREDPGNANYAIATIPKVVSGIDAASLELVTLLYSKVAGQVVPVSSPEVAEASKLLENTYRAVNIALVNELKMVYDRMGIDVWEVIEAAKTKPFGFHAFYPGPGLGGHCVPIDPFYLSWVARRHGIAARFIELAGEVNTAMPAYVVAKIAKALAERGKTMAGSRILLLGMAYKKDVDDTRESPGIELLHQLRRQGADVHYNDPHIPQLPGLHHCPPADLASQPLTEAMLRSQDCVVVVVDHSAYDWTWITEHAPLLVDTRNATRASLRHRARIVGA